MLRYWMLRSAVPSREACGVLQAHPSRLVSMIWLLNLLRRAHLRIWGEMLACLEFSWLFTQVHLPLILQHAAFPRCCECLIPIRYNPLPSPPLLLCTPIHHIFAQFFLAFHSMFTTVPTPVSLSALIYVTTLSNSWECNSSTLTFQNPCVVSFSFCLVYLCIFGNLSLIYRSIYVYAALSESWCYFAVRISRWLCYLLFRFCNLMEHLLVIWLLAFKCGLNETVLMRKNQVITSGVSGFFGNSP